MGQKKIRIGVVAPSSKVGQVELSLGVKFLRDKGFEVLVHPQCKKAHLFFAGTDEERAQAIFDFGRDDTVSVLWAARGGYGAIRLLPLLDDLTRKYGVPRTKKVLLGYSDVTVLMEYVRKKWGWATLHSPTPGYRRFSMLHATDLSALKNWLEKKPAEAAPWHKHRLQFWNKPPSHSIEAQMVGGNLTVWTSLIGTDYQPETRGKLIFFEDVDESLYRVDRMLQQLRLSKTLNGIRGIVLGTFVNCRDVVGSVLKKPPRVSSALVSPKVHELKPLRHPMKEGVLLKRLFSEFGENLGVPVAFGMPVGHGPENSPLPLGARYRLHPSGELELVDWDWI